MCPVQIVTYVSDRSSNSYAGFCTARNVLVRRMSSESVHVQFRETGSSSPNAFLHGK